MTIADVGAAIGGLPAWALVAAPLVLVVATAIARTVYRTGVDIRDGNRRGVQCKVAQSVATMNRTDNVLPMKARIVVTAFVARILARLRRDSRLCPRTGQP